MTITRALRPIPLLAAVLLAGCPEDNDPIGPEGDLVITTMSLPTAVLGVSYSAGIDAEGGDGEYHWDLESGRLPTGLDLSVEDLTDDDVVITGVPEEEGTFEFELRVESGDDQSQTRSFTLTVLCAADAVCIQTAALAPALAGFEYDVRLEALGGDGGGFTWTLESGTLPAGLVLEPTGRLHGTPTATDTAALIIGVEAGDQDSRTYVLQVVANRTGTYDITVAPVVPIPDAFVAVVDAAIERWQAAIIGDLPARSIATGTFSGAQCGGFGGVANGTAVDDVIVLVNIAPIDGQGAVLGSAGPCLIRTPGDLPIVGVLTLDAVDMGFLDMEEQIALVTHEIGHVLGFGSLWETFDLLTSSTSDPRYTGPAANAEWAAIGGAGQVPVENQGGEGTAGAHWRESAFGRELMTGFSNPNVFQPMSRVTIAALDDLGYAVNLSAADPFGPVSVQSSAQTQRAIAGATGHDVVYEGIIGRVDAQGRLIPMQPDTP